MVLTEVGSVAMQQAEEIFQLGETLVRTVRDADVSPGMRLAVGVADSVPKSVVWPWCSLQCATRTCVF